MARSDPCSVASTTRRRVGIESLDVVPVVVGDVDEAIDFYTGTLGFEVRTDEALEMEGASGRRVTVGVPGQALQLSLVTADEPYYDEATRQTLGAKQGTETWYTFRAAGCEASVDAPEAAGVEVTREPREYPWGTEALFADPFGNEFGLFEYAAE